MKLRVLPAARLDIFDIESRLESEHVGFGIDFVRLVDIAIESLWNQPRFYPRTEDGPKRLQTREYYIARFEYRVIYALGRNEIVVLGLVHARRKPGSWTGRLKTFKEQS